MPRKQEQQEENLYRRRSVPQQIPDGQQEAVDKERQQVLEQYDKIREEIGLINSDADFLENSVLAISEEALAYRGPMSFIKALFRWSPLAVDILANKKAAATLRSSAARMEALLANNELPPR